MVTVSPGSASSPGTAGTCREIRTVRRPLRAARTAAAAAREEVPAPPGYHETGRSTVPFIDPVDFHVVTFERDDGP